MKTCLRTFLIACSLVSVGSLINLNAITMNDGGISAVQTVARDVGVSFINAVDELTPGTVPFTSSHSAIQGASEAHAAYDFSESGFSITASGARAGSLDSRSTIQGTLYFSLSQDTTYSLSGSIAVQDPAASGKAVGLMLTLTDVDTLAVVYKSLQSSFGAVDQSFTLGGTAGNIENELVGLSAGTLVAGHRYQLSYQANTYASNAGDPASYSASFEVAFGAQAVPESGASILLLICGVAALLILRFRE